MNPGDISPDVRDAAVPQDVLEAQLLTWTLAVLSYVRQHRT
jgi:hypothetical protein